MSTLAYTPGLKRKSLYKVIKERRLPLPGELLVKIGDKVDYNTVVARAFVPGDPLEVSIATQLNCDAESAPKYMVKKIGDKLKKGDVLARKPGFLAFIGSNWGERLCLSPCDGTFEYLSDIEFFDEEVGRKIHHSSGRALIRQPPIPIEVDAYIPGTVVELLGKEGVAVECSAAFIQGIIGVGGETHGELMVVSDSPSDSLKAEDVGNECKGGILVGGSKVDATTLRKAVEVGAKGIVAGGIEIKDLNDFIGYRIGVAITGHEKTGLSLIITEGFGKMKMAQNTFELLKSFQGKTACINGATQIRAGVQRPEIIIPYDVAERGLKESGDELLMNGMSAGLSIRIIREPYFGALGHITSLPPELQKVRTESYVRVLEAELDDGRRVTVPRANVELIEE